MKAPRKKKKRKKGKRPLETVPLGKLLSNVEQELQMRFGDFDKPKRD